MLTETTQFAVTSLATIRRWWGGIPVAETSRAPMPLAPPMPLERSDLHTLWQAERSSLPGFVQESAAALKYLDLLGPLAWHRFPERDERARAWPGPKPAPRAPFTASYLVKLDKGLKSMPDLHEYLVEQPALVWLLGFPLAASRDYSWGFDVTQSLPTPRHLSRVLRAMDNAQHQFLLNGTVRLLQDELADDLPSDEVFGGKISLDTKHIIAWVVENNPKQYVKDRYSSPEKFCPILSV